MKGKPAMEASSRSCCNAVFKLTRCEMCQVPSVRTFLHHIGASASLAGIVIGCCDLASMPSTIGVPRVPQVHLLQFVCVCGCCCTHIHLDCDLHPALRLLRSCAQAQMPGDCTEPKPSPGSTQEVPTTLTQNKLLLT